MRKLLTAAALIMSVQIQAQSYFERIFGDSLENCTAVSITQLSTATLVIATNNFDSLSNASMKLYFFDTTGNMMNTVVFPPAGESVNRILALPGNELLLGGSYTDSTGNTDGMLMRIDTSGNIKWRTLLGRSLTDESFQGIYITADGSIIAGGAATNTSGPGNTGYLAKVDSAGNFIWDKIFSSTANTYIDAVIQLTNGNLIISGDRQLPTNNYTNYTICTDDTGAVIWDLPLTNPYNNGCKNDLLNSAGQIMTVGESSTAGNPIFDPAISRIDTSGSIVWSYIYSGSAVTTDALFDITEPFNEEYIAAGYGGNPVNGSADVLLMRIDSAGNEITRQYIGDTSGFDIGYSIITDQLKTRCYIVGTTVRNGINRGYLVYSGLMGIQTGLDDYSNGPIKFQIYPNPLSDHLYIKASENYGKLIIYNMEGKVLLKRDKIPVSGISVKELAAGIYLACLMNNNEIAFQRFSIVR